MAWVRLCTVIYSIISKQMETLHNTDPTRNTAQLRERDRFALILTGILIAIICSLIFLHDTYSTERVAATLPQLGEGSKIVLTDLPLEMKKFGVVSLMWPFR
jgi:hypothetical protein